MPYSQPVALARLKESLKANKWGVLADIDVKAVLKEKIGVGIKNYNILDVCNPGFANEALETNKRVGLVVPCKMAVYLDKGKARISLYSPTRQLPADIEGHDRLVKIAETTEGSLKVLLDGV